MSENIFAYLQDHFLLAMPGLMDPNFRHALIYVCEHTAEGAVGFTINHPIDMPMSKVFDALELQYPAEIGDKPLLNGGPVQRERGFVIHRAGPTRWESTIEVSDAIWITASRDIIVDIANNRGPNSSYLTLGYAGWGPGQLEEELANNSWLVTRADPAIMFETPFAERAQAAAAKLGIDLAQLSLQGGHA